MNDPYYQDDSVTLYHGDCLDILTELPDESIDAVVADPPYGIRFMGKAWDGADIEERTLRGREVCPMPAGVGGPQGGYRSRAAEAGRYDLSANAAFGVWCAAWASECLRVLKPGGHLLSFGGSRTWHRLAAAVEDAGFEIRDSIAWLYGSGFPKSLDVSKAIDKAAGAEREVLETIPDRWAGKGNVLQRSQQAENESVDITAPATDAARQWSGWGTAMKPAFEPIVCARKPLNPVPWDWRLVATVHHALAGLLWLSLSDAKRAEIRSASKNHALPEAWCVSALVSAATGTSLDESAKTATFNSQATASTCWNIVSSWSAILGALSDPTSTCTTSMKSSTTTSLRTLNSLLAPVISLNTMPACECLLAGRSSRAPSVASSSSEEWDKWTRTLSVSAPASAIEGIALAVRGALAAIADDFSSDLPESIAQQTATTGAGSSKGSHAFEPIVVARKPLGGKTVAANVLTHGTGALNIDGCRVEANDGLLVQGAQTVVGATNFGGEREGGKVYDQGRWPANTLLDPFAAAEVDEQSGISKSPTKVTRGGSRQESYGMGRQDDVPCYGDTGGASRFFPVFRYEAKAPTSERPTANGVAHPTVKPLDLMRWLVRLVTPPGGLVLDPFAGSGTTAEACIHEHMRCITIERESDYLPLIVARLTKPIEVGFNFGDVSA